MTQPSLRELLAAAIHEQSNNVHRGGIDPGGDSDQCVNDADAILATPSGKALASRLGREAALEQAATALTDFLDERFITFADDEGGYVTKPDDSVVPTATLIDMELLADDLSAALRGGPP